jgi:carbonic anhydrase
MEKSIFSNIKSDIASGIVVFLVALPLCLGIALASGAPFFSGLISGIIGGILIGYLSNSNLSVSGPAAGLAALVLGAITNLDGNYALFLCAVVIAGIVQIIMGIAKLGGISNYFPSSVIKGMLTSIGILIIAKQIPHAFGYDRDEKGRLASLFPFGDEDWHELLKPIQHIDLGVTLICVISIFILILWENPKVKEKVKPIPGALVAVIISILLNQLFINTNSIITIVPEHLVNIKAANSFDEFISFFTLPDFNGFTNQKVIISGIMIAVIASLETLLCIEAVDNLDPERNVTSTNRELVAQGVGNTVSGLIGGLPITSVIVRSSANLQSGAKTKLSTLVHGFLLLICVILIPNLLNKIPLSALAAILLLTGYKLAKLSVFKEMYKNGKYQFIPFMVTVGVIIGIDLFGIYKPLKGEGLLVGVVCGLIAAMSAILLGNYKNSYYFHKEDYAEGEEITVHLSDEVSFLNKAAIKQTLDHLPERSTVIIDASRTRYIDFDVIEIIKEFKNIKAPLKNIKLSLVNFKDTYKIDSKGLVESH